MNRLLASLGAVLLLAACSGSSSDTAASPSLSPSPSSSPGTSVAASGDAPTPEQVDWAGQVCTDASGLRTSIQGVTTATPSDEDVGARVAQQVTAIATSTDTLVETIADVPSGSEDDPDLVAIRTSSDQLRASVDTLETAANTVRDTSGTERTRALADVVDAAQASLTALSETTTAIGAAAKSASGTLGQAFAANTSCTSL